MALGVDVSNYQPIPMQADCDALKAYGIEFAIVGLQDPLHGESQAVVFRTFGITVEDCYIESTLNPRIPDGMKRGWVAVETGSGIVTEPEIDSQLDWLRQAGLEAGIYTSSYMISLLGLAPLFEAGGKYHDIPKWLADYDDNPSPLAGAAIKQYSGTGRVPGIAYELDLDYRDDAPAQEETVDVTALDFDQTVAANEAVYAHFSNVAIDQHGGGMYEVSAQEAAKFQVNGGPIPLPTTGRIFVTVLPE